MNLTKLLAVASIGGHWKQLLRIVPPTSTDIETVYVCTHPKCATMVEGHRYYSVGDFSRWNFYKIVPAFFQAIRIIRNEAPDAVITTGAAPGLIFLLAAKLLGKKTVWIDSVANVLRLSMSGKIASKFASRIYTQWKELSSPKIFFAGSVLD
jgi:UDP-N-acetylglucosamine:LPS N-acetylglucosamine transferase